MSRGGHGPRVVVGPSGRAGAEAFQSSIRSRWADQSVCGARGLNQVGGRRLWVEAMTNGELARASASRSSRRRDQAGGGTHGGRHEYCRARPAAARQATDLSVAQAVEAEREDLARDGDLGDLAAAALGDPLEVSRSGPQPRTACWAASTSAQRSGREPWLGDVAEAGFTVGASDRRGQAGPGAQLARLAKREMSPTSAITSIAV